ncbi:MAG TPA: alpha/beta hydrolase [Verrucomicrobiae bacterium]|nr:alpha/beta hydrolase [Verrucomicrobiae bacterium]
MRAPFLAVLVLASFVPASAASRFEDGAFVEGGAKLVYTLTRPEGAGPFPAVVLVHGSGEVTRGMMSFLVDEFVSRGVAVLAYDKRGVGRSEGKYSGVGVKNSDAMISQLARDASRGMETLSKAAGMDAKRLGFAGGSQAGWIIPPALGMSRAASFAVILSGPTVTVGEENRYSDLVEDAPGTVAEGHKDLETFKGPYGFDPKPYVRAMTAKTLWLYGAEDRSIPALRCLPIFDELKQAGRTNHTVKVYPGEGHSLGPGIWIDVEAWLRAQGIVRAR